MPSLELEVEEAELAIDSERDALEPDIDADDSENEQPDNEAMTSAIRKAKGEMRELYMGFIF